MPIPSENIRKFISENAGTFLIAGAMVLLPLIGGYAYLVSEYKALNEGRVSLEKERALATLEVGKSKLEVEKLQAQLTNAMDVSKTLLAEVSNRQKQTEAEKQQLADAWKNIDAWRQKLNPDQEFKTLSEEFTAMGVDLNRCVPSGEQEKFQRAKLVAQRIYYAAIQTGSQLNVAFAKNIQPISPQPFGCPSRQNAP